MFRPYNIAVLVKGILPDNPLEHSGVQVFRHRPAAAKILMHGAKSLESRGESKRPALYLAEAGHKLSVELLPFGGKHILSPREIQQNQALS